MTIARSPAPLIPVGPRFLSCRGSLRLHDRRAGRGFTLVEILTVMAILSLLTAITLPAIRGFGERGALTRTRGELSLMAGALEIYRRTYGDYPQTGNFLQASPETTQALRSDHAQARFFNALRGALGPNCTDNGSGPGGGDFIDFARLATEFALPADGRIATCNALLDPWGRRYLYYYKSADNPEAWGAAGYVLYSAGPDGRHVPPDPADGNGGQDSRTAAVNGDNVYADALTR
jgi:prepilin-type N-terminal cleavage/methylation domain-containing protein